MFPTKGCSAGTLDNVDPHRLRTRHFNGKYTRSLSFSPTVFLPSAAAEQKNRSHLSHLLVALCTCAIPAKLCAGVELIVFHYFNSLFVPDMWVRHFTLGSWVM